MAKEKSEIEKRPPNELAVSSGEMNEMFGESKLDTGIGLSFNVAKIIRETAQFDLGNDQFKKTLTGHILFMHLANQWWKVPFDERGEDDDPMPQCFSIDGIKSCGGSEMQNDLCGEKICPLDTFDSGKDGRGKACRNTRRFLFLQDGAVLPIIIVAPPTSFGKKRAMQQWLNSFPNSVAMAYRELSDELRPRNKEGQVVEVVDYWPAHVELSLEKKTFGNDAIVASLLCIKTLDVLTPKSDSDKLRRLFPLRKETLKIYEAEQHSYIATEHSEDHSEEKVCDDIPI